MAKDLKDRTAEKLTRAVERFLTDEKHAAQIARAVGAVQKSRQALDDAQQRVLRTLGLAGKDDYKDVGKRIATLKRRVRHLAEKAEKLAK